MTGALHTGWSHRGRHLAGRIWTGCVLLIVAATAHGAVFAQQPTPNRLQDVRIGERGEGTRIALFCRTGCSVQQNIEGFFIAGIKDALTIDLAKYSANAHKITMRPVPGGVILQLVSPKVVLRSSVNDCRLEGVRATCIDLEFSPLALRRAPVLAQPRMPIATPEKPVAKPQAISLRAPQDLAARRASRIADRPGPGLRDGQQSPQRVPRIAVSASIPATPAAVRPSVLRPAETGFVLGRVDFREQAELILERRLDSEACASAKAQLARDAWALGAMTTLGFCHGAKGEFEQAETIFRRLGGHNGADHEVLIGRALIAAIAGERSIARKFFNDALEAGPPDPVSTRINATMAKLAR